MKNDPTTDGPDQPPSPPLSLQFNISASQARRAFDAPYDNNVVEELHGVKVSDPFRPLENLDAPETKAWAARADAAFQAYVGPAAAAAAQTVDFMQRTVPQGMRESMPTRYGDVTRSGASGPRTSANAFT